jgi:hypothetical protein
MSPLAHMVFLAAVFLSLSLAAPAQNYPIVQRPAPPATKLSQPVQMGAMPTINNVKLVISVYSDKPTPMRLLTTQELVIPAGGSAALDWSSGVVAPGKPAPVILIDLHLSFSVALLRPGVLATIATGYYHHRTNPSDALELYPIIAKAVQSLDLRALQAAPAPTSMSGDDLTPAGLRIEVLASVYNL